MSRKLARQVFHGMVVHGPRLQNKQAFLFRLVDIANELFVMASSLSRAHALRREQREDCGEAVHLADIFCRQSSRKIRRLFQDLWSNDDVLLYKSARRLLETEQPWMERGVFQLEEMVERAKRHAQIEQGKVEPETVQMS
jgi:hypothetical protein